MIRGRKTIKGEKLTNSHGGIGKYIVRTLFQKNNFQSNILYVREIILLPGSSIGIHKHEKDEEIYYIAEGTGEITLNNCKKEVTVGDTILTKSGNTHGLLNNSKINLRFFVICVKI